MSVAAISPYMMGGQLGSLQNPIARQGTTFQELSQALQTGNLSSAQQIFSALTQNTSGFCQVQNSQLQQDLNTIGADLNAGNVAEAQKAYSAFKTDVQNTIASTHSHHHHAYASTQQPSNSTLDTPNLGADPLRDENTLSNFLSPLSIVA